MSHFDWIYALPTVGGGVIEIMVDFQRFVSDPSDMEFYSLDWVVRHGPLWPKTIAIPIHKCLWDTDYFNTVSIMQYGGKEHRLYLYEAVIEALWADSDYWSIPADDW